MWLLSMSDFAGAPATTSITKGGYPVQSRVWALLTKFAKDRLPCVYLALAVVGPYLYFQLSHSLATYHIVELWIRDNVLNRTNMVMTFYP